MIIGIPKEIKDNEFRVSLTPAGVEAFLAAGHTVLIEVSAGEGSGFTDEEYVEAGAIMVSCKKELFDRSEMIIKVKEPLPEEYDLFHEGQILFTYLHLAPEPELAKALIRDKVVGIAYETVQLPNRSLPLLTPMSEIAGRMAPQIGARFLEKRQGGKGVLLSGVPGVLPGKVVIIGGGMVGTNAAKIAYGLGADVTVIDINTEKLVEIDQLFQGNVKTLMSNSYNIANAVKDADLVIGAVLIPGAKAPKLVKENMVKAMKPGSVIIDVAIDQGGSIETSDRVTTHTNPTYEKYGVVHYAVANIPGSVARTSTLALTNATLPYALQIANKGYVKAIKENEALAKGVNVIDGKVTYKAVADALGMEYYDIYSVLG